MTKLLQKKFIMTAMMAISLLIFILLGTINIVNIVIVRSDIDRTLQLLTETRMDLNIPEMLVPSQPPDVGFGSQTGKNRLLSSPYFVVVTDAYGNMIFSDLSHIGTIDEDDATAIVKNVIFAKTSEGKSGGYRYKTAENPFGGKVIAFLDTTNEIYSYLRILLLSAGLGALCWGLMHLVVIALSKKAIRPIAENIEKQKEFITNAGHEIKTPLAIIQANTDAMELYAGENKWSKNIRQQVTRLDGLMKNMLLLTRSDENGIKAEKSVFSLSEVVRETANGFSEPLKLKGVELRVTVADNIMLSADKEQITQLVSVLLDNACKYTNDNGQTGIFLDFQQNSIVLNVTNTVAELPNVMPEKLFDRFYRADTARTQKTGGYGIGLSVAKAICEANNAKISVSYGTENSIRFQVVFTCK